MNGFREDGKILADKIYEELLKKENKELSSDEILDIYESFPYPVFRKTEFYVGEFLKEKSDIERFHNTLRLK